MYNAAVIFLCAFFAKYSRIAFLSMTKGYYFFLTRFNMYFSFEEFYIDIICIKKTDMSNAKNQTIILAYTKLRSPNVNKEILLCFAEISYEKF